MRRILIAVFTALIVTWVTGQAQAQVIGPRLPTRVLIFPVQEMPRSEIEFHLGLWTMMEGGGEFGGRLTRNVTDSFAFDYSLTHRPAGGARRASTLGSASLRFLVEHPTKPRAVYATVGLAAGNSANFSFSPVIGMGIQSLPVGRPGQSRFLMFRVGVEIITNTKGDTMDDLGRLTFGFSYGFGKRN